MAGIATRSIYELFRLMERDSQRFKFETEMYVVELYMEDIFDLLWKGSGQRPPLSVHLDGNGVVDVENVTKVKVASVSETLGALRAAFKERKVSSTKMNHFSSRSHLVCSILITATCLASDVVTTGKLTLVDLAGSERAGKTGATDNTLKEANAINKSLLALGNVISALTSGAKHIPYRSHPLTQLMADSLGGNAKTLMFVNVSPADYNLGETKESLRWAQRIKEVTNTSSKNTEDAQVKALKDQIEKLKQNQTTKQAVQPVKETMKALKGPPAGTQARLPIKQAAKK